MLRGNFLPYVRNVPPLATALTTAGAWYPSLKFKPAEGLNSPTRRCKYLVAETSVKIKVKNLNP